MKTIFLNKWIGLVSVLLLLMAPVVQAQPPFADYGDAPDPLFPSLFLSSGPRHLALNDCFVGWMSTGEPNALVPNLDMDDGGPMIYADLDYGIWSGWLYFPITLSPTATPGISRYVNVLFDRNESGTWCDVAGEWIVRNFPLPSYGIVHNPGQTVWYCLGGFTGVTDFSGIHWIRITLSDIPIPANVANGWDGRFGPSFAFGETEDWPLTWYYNPNSPPPPDPPVPPVPPFDPLDPNPPQPVPAPGATLPGARETVPVLPPASGPSRGLASCSGVRNPRWPGRRAALGPRPWPPPPHSGPPATPGAACGFPGLPGKGGSVP